MGGWGVGISPPPLKGDAKEELCFHVLCESHQEGPSNGLHSRAGDLLIAAN